ncbi:MAG: hypothetical protein JWM85_319 [Acidimicrobiaceae bacterium]|nr:hypothetical protein [Acidimicrobiaceae bacterium]
MATSATATVGLMAAPSLGASQAPPGEVTAEIPIVTGKNAAARPVGNAYGVLLPDGTVWYPGSRKRLPAPFALRLTVWLLFLVLLIGLGGLAVERVHPTWLDFARRTASPAAVAAGTSPPATTGRTAGQGGSATAGFHLVKSASTTATYATGAGTYDLVLTFSHPVWTVVASPAGSQHFLVEQTLQPSASPKQVVVNGTASVQLSAATDSIQVQSAGKTLGTVSAPRVGTTYTFEPSSR